MTTKDEATLLNEMISSLNHSFSLTQIVPSEQNMDEEHMIKIGESCWGFNRNIDITGFFFRPDVYFYLTKVLQRISILTGGGDSLFGIYP